MKAYRYRVTVECLERPEGAPAPGATPLVFETTQHDDLDEIVARAQARGDLPRDDATVFAVGLKLFASTMLAHRQLPLFANLQPAFKAFMQTLKQGPAA